MIVILLLGLSVIGAQVAPYETTSVQIKEIEEFEAIYISDVMLNKPIKINLENSSEFSVNKTNLYIETFISLESKKNTSLKIEYSELPIGTKFFVLSLNGEKIIGPFYANSKEKHVSIAPVSESNFIMECKLYDILELGNKPASGNLILGEVLKFHINESILDSTDKVDPYKLDPIARNGGSWYTEAKKGLFELKKPNNIGIGFDAIPDKIKKSKHFNGTQLAKLAGVKQIPENLKLKQKGNLSELYSACQEKLDNNEIQDAWQIIFNFHFASFRWICRNRCRFVRNIPGHHDPGNFRLILKVRNASR